MGKMRQRFLDLPLKKALRYMVIFMVFVVLLLSALSILGCSYAQKRLLPESQKAYLYVDITYTDGNSNSFRQVIEYDIQSALAMLVADGQEKREVLKTEYTVERIENSVENLPPKKKTAYYVLGGMMVILPMVYSVMGMSLCAWYFYKSKLKRPLKVLSDAAENIRNFDLDFTVDYDSRDEMGKLAAAFEQMRAALYRNNQELWKMIRDEKELQASLAHDLRNPIAVLKGYAEYLQQCVRKGNLNEEKVHDVAENLLIAALRMEQYTDSVKELNSIEELEVNKEIIGLPEYLRDMAEDFNVVAMERQKEFHVVIPDIETEIAIDRRAFSRIMENIFMNALRFARKNIEMECRLCGANLLVCMTDDGNGFADELLRETKAQSAAMRKGLKRKYGTDTSDGHMGMGLVIGRILAEKHGGDIKIENSPEGGGRVTVTINIEKVTEC